MMGFFSVLDRHYYDGLVLYHSLAKLEIIILAPGRDTRLEMEHHLPSVLHRDQVRVFCLQKTDVR